MFGGDRDRFAETEAIGIIHARFGATRFGLVGNEHDRLVLLAQHIGEDFIDRGQAGFCIDEKERDVGIVDRGFRLGAHAAFERIGTGNFQTGGVDHGEAQIDKARVTGPAVTGDAGGIVDEGKLPAGEPVEQGRLADIGPPDDCESETHERPVSGPRPKTRQEVSPRPAMRSSITPAR